MTGAAKSAGDTDYASSGDGYDLQRRADPRIGAYIEAGLGSAASVLNVGAGAGSYEPTDRYVLAVEPALSMRGRRRGAGASPAIIGCAESLPFDDNAVDAAMAVFTVHQWNDLVIGLAELRRVTSGPILILTLDPDQLSGYWLSEYLPTRLAAEQRRFPAIGRLVEVLGGVAHVESIPIPRDCTDGFIEAFYARPEALLDPSVRAAQSGWGFLDADVAERGLSRLATDLASGTWDERYGHLRNQPTYVGPLQLVTATP